MYELIDVENVEKLFNNLNYENVKENLNILLKVHKRRIIKSLQLIQLYIGLDRLKEAYDVLNIFMDEFLGDFHEKISEIFKKFFF